MKEPGSLKLTNVDNETQLPWYGLSLQDFNDKWAYQPIELIGSFDHSKEILVHKVRDGNITYLITLFNLHYHR